MLKYIELKTGYNDNGPAWIGYVTQSKTKRTVYFNGHAFRKVSGQNFINCVDIETGDEYWISGIRKRGSNRHWAGSGKILIESSAVPEFLRLTGAEKLDKSCFEITDDIVPTDIERFTRIENPEASTCNAG